ncbi:hypothetical protein chiPu_0032441, partial [Chiloscyllium punctatum]|nr:hypothetical protein [Chiloscyllium punctatum]
QHALSGLHGAAVLRQPARQADRARQGSAERHQAARTRAGRAQRRGHFHDKAPAPGAGARRRRQGRTLPYGMARTVAGVPCRRPCHRSTAIDREGRAMMARESAPSATGGR